MNNLIKYVNFKMQRVNVMKNISNEFRKGILFIRLKRRTNNESSRHHQGSQSKPPTQQASQLPDYSCHLYR